MATAQAPPLPQYLNCTYRGAQARGVVPGDGSFFCPFDGGVEIKAGQTIRFQKSYLHIPGSDQITSGAIYVPQQVQTRVQFYYYVKTLNEDAGDDAYGMIVPNNGDHTYFNQMMLIAGSNWQKQLDEFWLTIPAGTHEPTALAELLTQQSRQITTVQFPGVSSTGYARFCPTTNTPTMKQVYGRCFTRGMANQLVLSAANTHALSNSNKCGDFRDLSAEFGIGSNQGMVIAWNEGLGRFQITSTSTPIVDQNGNTVILRNSWQAGQTLDVQWAGDQCGICVAPGGWHTNTANFADSIWNVLGFQQSDLEVPLPHNDLNGNYTAVWYVPSPAQLAGGENPWWSTDGRQAFSVQPTQPSNALTATNAPNYVSETAYWLVSAELVQGTSWREGDGQRYPTVLGTIDRSYASADVYVSDAGPGHPVLADMVVSGIRVAFLDPSTMTPEPTTGAKSAVQIAII